MRNYFDVCEKVKQSGSCGKGQPVSKSSRTPGVTQDIKAFKKDINDPDTVPVHKRAQTRLKTIPILTTWIVSTHTKAIIANFGNFLYLDPDPE